VTADDRDPPAPIPAARLLFSLDPAVAHLNHGSHGAVPIPVQRAQQRLRDEMDANPMRFYTRGLKDRLAAVRRLLAEFLGADADGTALIGNATAGASIVLNSIPAAAGDEIVTTDHGYGAVALAVQRRCRATGAEPRTVPLALGATVDEIVAGVGAALRPGRTRLLIVDHVASPTARQLPVEALVATARDAGVPVLVDAAHAPGMLPLEVAALGADFWVGNLHKWAYAPRGTAALCVAPRWRHRIEPVVTSWEQPSGYPRAVEWQGTLDYTGHLAAPAGLATLCALGIGTVRAHNADLAAYGQRVVGAALGLDPGDLLEPGWPGGPGVSMRLLPLPDGLAADEQAAQALRLRIAEELATEAAVVSWSGRGFLRLSAQIYNHAEEYDRLAEHLPGLLASHADAPRAHREVQGQQAHPADAEQRKRVEVLDATAQPPVQAGRSGTARMARGQPPDEIAACQPVAGPHRRIQGFVGRP
jgi:isopenicillin-N epimerase